MGMLDAVNTMKQNIDQANALVAQLNPLHEAFNAELAKIESLDRSRTYFGVNADGTATLVSFDPTSGAPKFSAAEPLHEEDEQEHEGSAQACEVCGGDARVCADQELKP